MQGRPHAGGLGDSSLGLFLELLVKGLTLLVQDKTKAQTHQVCLDPLPDQRCGMISHLARRVVDLAGGFLPDLLSRIQNAVNGGGRNPCLAGDILDRGSAGHGILTKKHQILAGP